MAKIKDHTGSIIPPTDSETKDFGPYTALRDLFYRFNDLDKEETKRFEEKLKNACIDTVIAAPIIATTDSNALAMMLLTNIKPTRYFCHEAGQGDEVTVMGPVWMYPSIRHVTIVGDPAQLAPFVNEPAKNPFAKQLAQSESARKKTLHFPCQGMLRTQFRSTTGINAYSNEKCYHGQLVDGPRTDIGHQTRLLSRQLKEFHEVCYGVSDYDIMLDMKRIQSRKEDSPKTSSYNDEFTFVIATYL